MADGPRRRQSGVSLYLEDRETGNHYPLGASSKKTILLPAEQESICRGLYREHWIVLLGLGAPEDEEDY